jgi:hypothetical protein
MDNEKLLQFAREFGLTIDESIKELEATMALVSA